MYMHSARKTREFVGARIRQFRNERGLSVGQLEDRSGVSELAISRMEEGHTPMLLEDILSVARALDVDAALLFGDPEDEEEAQEHQQE